MRRAVFLSLLPLGLCCSNILVTPGASADGTTLLGDNDDSSRRHGLVTHFDSADHQPGSTRPVYDFEAGTFNGNIPQPAHTYSTISHANEKGVVIAETTQGGLEVLDHSGQDYRNGTIMDYGSLIKTTLQRASTAREAIHTLVNLSNTYGYASAMEGFSITDGIEAWYMELIGKGKWGTGIVWVALRVPDGYVTANANQARITTFLPCDDPNYCLAAPDAVSFAIKHGFWQGDPNDPAFSFSDTYDPVQPTGARFCEARVWYVFSQIADPADFNASYYLPYAQGFNLTRRMPLWVRPKQKLTRAVVHALLSSTFEGSWFDPTLDVGAGAEHTPNRWNGLTWALGDTNYVNERIVGTQYTAWHYVASVRNASTPPPMRALLWWGSDDHGIAPKVPLYGAVTKIHRTYDDGNCSAQLACRQALGLPGSMIDFSWDSAYWVNSAVAKLVYSSKDRASSVVAKERELFEEWVAPLVLEVEDKAMQHWNSGNTEGVVSALNELALKSTEEATKRWTKLWQKLMTTFVDGYTMTEDPSNKLCGCKKTALAISDAWKKKIVVDTGDHYRLPDGNCAYIDADGHCHNKPTLKSQGNLHMKPISKLKVPGVLN